MISTQNNNYKISVVIPLYNKFNEVRRAVDSVLAQTVQDFEILVIDGGSTDGSRNFIKKYESDPRYRMIRQTSKGVSAARNDAVAVSTTDLIAFLDADDEWLPDFLEQILLMRKLYPNAGLYGTAYIPTYALNHQALSLCEIPPAPWVGIIPSYFRSSALAKCPPFCTSCVAIPKNIFEQLGGFNTSVKMGEDTDLWARIALQYQIAYTSKPCAKYNWIANSKATDKHIAIQHHPFFTYFNKLHITEASDVRFYLEYEELNMAYINLIAGNRGFVKENLKYVKSKEFQKRKLFFMTLSLLPNLVVKQMPFVKRVTFDKLKCIRG
ncbi:MAG: glycosyltransferase family 2 protein [Clostridiales bacterium]|jgi:glycosyltransferase involved in cell wall biosynthesis|nr:glycosyltransferase family 2 protein [Clostridiales bacterium]